MDNQPYPSQSVSTKHNGIAHPNPSPEVQCSYPGCEKIFKTAVELRKHSVRHDLRYACSTCDKGFGRKSDRDRHQATVHSQDTSHHWYCTEPGCARPDRGFSRSDNFKKHMKKVHGRDVDADNTSPRTSPALPAGGPRDPGRENAAADKGDSRREETEVQALGKVVRELSDKMDVLCREREAEARRQRERDAENARLFGLLGRVASSGGPQADTQGGSDGR